jgi:hypothetical protein
MSKVKFTAAQVARGKAQQRTIEKQRELFVANEPKPKVELRDYFLAAAIQGLCANPNIIWHAKNMIAATELVILASKIADEAMLHGR